ncbi:PREDICTED: unconventional myosin-Va [Nicrophorus vespilloides]|uniref:Unconventional myosin-Va n=2 Tax=Nicrophorus vespilloides TaxID=110193 RepID=A0ABM1MD51_NICVS|nr:PREDICTED: unconventional myosin-Va [Nicrophorus vespilloides]
MTTLELYTKGAKVWIPHPERIWEAAELQEDYSPSKKTLQVLTENNEQKSLQVKAEKELPFLRNPQILIGENDLTSLSYLHEPAVLYNLQVRFCQHKDIYTYCGIVLVAINPYDDLPIYDIDTIQTYRGQAMGDLDPHIFAVAEEAYTQLEREQRDQSIIVSGESGAGKTVSAKYAMRYFATVGGNATETQVEKKVLASSPIMEAIGNAKTTRNDNSSRFGKFIELQFNKQFNISGASMRTYLLEKSRVVFQAPGERNYHIFYQLCAAKDQLPHLKLDDSTKFHYLNQGRSPTVDGVNDLQTYEETTTALALLGFNESERNDMFKILAAILHLGNLKFKEMMIRQENEQDQEGCGIQQGDKSLSVIGELLDIDVEELEQWLCIKKMVSMREVFLIPMSLQQAMVSRDALAKHIYAILFNWIVLIINKALESEVPKYKFIGVLDIYGFETFEINSFEQFCINYANEKLQQQFNMHVFKLEQEEYIKEEIEWKMIDYLDNQPCIDLIETKLGILDLLDEECRMPKGTDGSWTEKLYAKCMQYSHFTKARFGTSAFVINHFADKVQYESSGFLEKNRDTVIEEQINVIKASKNDLVRRLFAPEMKQSTSLTKLKVISAKPAPKTKKTNKKTVGSQFRDSLNMLMNTLNATTPHYVRCIKPNDTKTAFEYNPKRAVEQLRACGVLETIRISSAGFPSRWTYPDFFSRYRVLCKFVDISRNSMQITCQRILTQYIKNSDMYQFGKTKIFFRAGQVAYLEKLRADKLKKCCIVMQSTVRAFIWRKKYIRIKKAIHNLQRYSRGYLARRLANDLRRNKAAIIIQRYTRGWVKRTQYKKKQQLLLGIQRFARGFLARKRYMKLKYNAKALIIQRFVRGWLARKRANKRKRQIILCQATIRRFLARRRYKKLRIEARSIEHVKKLNVGLENKIFMLQQKIEDLNKTKTELTGAQNDISDLKNKLITFKAMELEIKNMKTLLVKKNDTIDHLEEKVKIEQSEKMDLVHDQEKYQKEIEDERNHWMEETSKLRKELDNINEIVKMNEEGAEEHLKARLEQEKIILLKQQDNDTMAYQRLLEEYHQLESHCDNLEKLVSENNRQNYHHVRNVSDVSSIIVGEESHSDIQDDHGYGSVRSTSSSNHAKLENIDWKEGHTDSIPSSSSSSENTKMDISPSKTDVALVLKLQHKLAEVEREKSRLQKRLDDIETSPRAEQAENNARDSIKINELELSNSNLKSQLMELRGSIEDGTGNKQLSEQLVTMQSELDRKMEEIIQLKSVLASQTDSMKSLVSSKTRTGTYINEDGELALAYETQKAINKQLELELQDEKVKYKAHEKEYKLEIDKLREDNERQQRILSANLKTTPQSQTEAFMSHEITRLTTENLNLTDANDNLGESVRKLKKHVKLLTKKLKDNGIDIDESIVETGQMQKHARSMPCIKKKDREYLGMFAYKEGEEAIIAKSLVIDLKPRTAVTLLPGLPAYIMFMCIRHTDHINDDDKVRALLSAFTNSVKKVLKKRNDDFETITLWLSNTLRLLHNMKQYSGDKAFQTKNTQKQNDQRLRNFDLSEYRQLLSDIAVWIYLALIQHLQEKIQPLVVPAILEHEEIQGLSGGKPGFRKRTSSIAKELESPKSTTKPTTALLQELTSQHKILSFYGVDPEVISQVFRQLFYFLCASSLNNLLLRKELCHWSKGFQIRHNLSHLEMWTREKQLTEIPVQEALQPIIQAAHLLQARKKDEDVDSVCEMCSALTPLQICKILNLYTPVDEFEQRVPVTFIRKVQAKLNEREGSHEPQALLMDIKYTHPVRFPFNPSIICLESIDIPDVLKLNMLEKI